MLSAQSSPVHYTGSGTSVCCFAVSRPPRSRPTSCLVIWPRSDFVQPFVSCFQSLDLNRRHGKHDENSRLAYCSVLRQRGSTLYEGEVAKEEQEPL